MPTPIKSWEEIREEFYSKIADFAGPENSAIDPYPMQRIADFFISQAQEREAELEKHRYWEPCSGCKDGHPSFWKTVVESPEWKRWEKEQSRRLASETKEGCFDIDECRECGWISPAHFQEFLDFCWEEREAGMVEETNNELGEFWYQQGWEGGYVGARNLIQDEIDWHEENDSSEITKEYRDGFIKGLKQAKLLLLAVIDNFKKHEKESTK